MVFLEVFVASRDRADLILAALFLWRIFFLAARSAKEIAAFIFSKPLLLFAERIASSSLFVSERLTWVFLFEPRRALFAVLVTGML